MSYQIFECNTLRTGYYETTWENSEYAIDGSSITYAYNYYNQGNAPHPMDCLVVSYDSTAAIGIDETSITAISIGVEGKFDENFNNLYVFSPTKQSADQYLGYSWDSTAPLSVDIANSDYVFMFNYILDSTGSEVYMDIKQFVTNVEQIKDRYIILCPLSIHPFIPSYDIKVYINRVFWRIDYDL